MVVSVFFAVPVTVSAAETEAAEISATYGDYTYTVLSDGTAEITEYTGSAESITIPSTLDEYNVTSIGKESIPTSTKIYCYKDSAAEEYAISNGNDYEILSDTILGDADGDGRITVKDATAIQEHVADIIVLDNEQSACADTDRDGKISVRDATRIQKFLADLITEL